MEFSWKKVITFSGAIVAYLIGSGFASGQEAMQFLASFGLVGCTGAIIMTCAIYLGFCYSIMDDGYKLQLTSSNKIFEYYCGKYVGRFYEFYTPIFLFLVFVVMISGAGAILSEYYGVAPVYGRVIIVLLSLSTVMLGLNNLVNIVSKIGPIIILFIVIVGGTNIIMNPSGLAQADETLKSITVIKAAPTWYISGLIFPAMGCMMITPFLASLGARARSGKEARYGGLGGGLLFSIAVTIFSYGLLTSIGELYEKSIPTLFIANKISPVLGMLFSIILICGVYNTAVLMLWLSCNRIFQDEKSKKFRISAVVLAIIAFVASKFPFATLVNLIYPFTGYLGIFLLICILVKRLRKKASASVAK
ncbi:MAG: hypothetical protein WCR27_04235 [Eubacteriales bacterium]